MNNILPVELQREILSYISNLDKLEYARCNRTLCRELMKRSRIITIREERKEYLTSESFRNKILGLIVDPYEQLGLNFNFSNEFNLPANSMLRNLIISLEDFRRCSPHILLVQHLTLWGRATSERITSQISGLRRLLLMGCYKSFIASFSDQLDLSSLQSIVLYDCSLTDVSCFAHVYELHLVLCYGLVDISCLNHNKIIVINSCPILDYSQSFRFSRDITIAVSKDFNPAYGLNNGINLDDLEEVQSLTIYSNERNVTDPISFREHLPSSLRTLTLNKLGSRVLIPPGHNVKEITISGCRDVSLQNFEKIRVVKIDRCHEITDWTPLQGIASVEISCCNGFTSGQQLINVNKLTLTNTTLNHMEDLTNITHLKLDKYTGFTEVDASPYIASSTRGKELFSSAINLQEIELKINFYNPHISILHSIMKSPQHKRIVMTLRNIDLRNYKSNFETFHRRIVRNFARFYEVEIKAPRTLVLLKREQIKEDEGGLFSSLGITSIFNYLMQR